MGRILFGIAFVCAFLSLSFAPLSASGDGGSALVSAANAERLRAGLPALSSDPELRAMALAYATQMVQGGFFGHTDPRGATFQDRLRARRVRYRWAAENIGQAADARTAAAAFAASPEHEANIVARDARRMGSALVTLPTGDAIAVEEFSD